MHLLSACRTNGPCLEFASCAVSKLPAAHKAPEALLSVPCLSIPVERFRIAARAFKGRLFHLYVETHGDFLVKRAWRNRSFFARDRVFGAVCRFPAFAEGFRTSIK